MYTRSSLVEQSTAVALPIVAARLMACDLPFACGRVAVKQAKFDNKALHFSAPLRCGIACSISNYSHYTVVVPQSTPCGKLCSASLSWLRTSSLPWAASTSWTLTRNPCLQCEGIVRLPVDVSSRGHRHVGRGVLLGSTE